MLQLIARKQELQRIRTDKMIEGKELIDHQMLESVNASHSLYIGKRFQKKEGLSMGS
jgi:hypothetical protein